MLNASFIMLTKVFLITCIAALATARPTPSPEGIQAIANGRQLLLDAAQFMEDSYKKGSGEPLPASNYKDTTGFVSRLANVAFVQGTRPYPGLAENVADDMPIQVAKMLSGGKIDQ